jgi:hypothetical protein
MTHGRTLLMSTIGIAIALLAACGGSDDAPTAQPTAQASPANPLSAQTNEISKAGDGSLAQFGPDNVAQRDAADPARVVPTQIEVSPDQRFVGMSTGAASNAAPSLPINPAGTLDNPVADTTRFATHSPSN